MSRQRRVFRWIKMEIATPPESPWPFEDAPNTGTIVSRYVLEGEPIVRAHKGWEDRMWQFLSARAVSPEDGRIVCLQEVYARDSSIGELADLPSGWMAERRSRSSKWDRKKDHPFPVYRDDGFYLEDATEYTRLWPETYPPISEAVRENLQAGEIVKLVFRFADESEPRADNQCERMWVEVCEVDSENIRYRGTLANDPALHNQIAYGHALWFHPIHVLGINGESSG